jgi:hypothetical protein
MKKILGCLVLACVAGVATRAAASDDRWIHVRVDDADGAKGRVDIQVPVGLVSSLLPALKGVHSRGSIHVDRKRVDLAELRGYWNAVRAARDGEYVTVRDEDSDVRIAKSGGYLRLTVDGKGGGNRVRMKIPLPLVDAALAGGDTLDLDALGKAFANAPMGELLTVDDEDSHVRIWIDARPAPAREDRP